ncbi:hypothetical protein B0T25DRAFT_597435 [Lasiosphaeria hispida]|uniref:Uncharacterized protein n=1 Tax=Lasiosphaeria hispida TaxID=260671 RepID=A0AAJ0MKK3_9PEZI|nr:hypothetical protein B0T25DRAFT_597435 [Lasiosphaeria hispida]
MDMVNFSEAEAYAAWRSEQSAYGAKYANIFITFQNLLTASGDDNSSSMVETTATAMANFIRAVGRQDNPPRESLLDACWDNMMRMVDGIPLNHPWHAVFVRTIHVLHELVGERIFSQPTYTVTWDELDEMKYHFWDCWDERSMSIGFRFSSTREGGNDEYIPLAGPEKDNEVIRWKRWTSMFAQMPDCLALPYYIMRAVQPLESPIDGDSIDAECTLWTACEWLIHRAYQSLECLRAHHIEKDELSMGDLYSRDVGDPCSLKRWDWWKHRVQELAADGGVEKHHVARALASMEAAEARPSEVELEEKQRVEKEKEGKEGEEEKEE